jgi:hypothetical protein
MLVSRINNLMRNLIDKILVLMLSLIPGFIFWSIIANRKDWEDWYM